MSVFSKKHQSELGERIKSNALVRFLDDIITDNKAQALSKKASRSFCLKKGEIIKFSKHNFSELLLSFSSATLGKSPHSSQLLSSISRFLHEHTEASKTADSELLMRILYKKDTVSMEKLHTIDREITNQLTRSKNSVYLLIFNLWYEYMTSRYAGNTFGDAKQAKSCFHKDVVAFGELLANIIYHLFYDWFFAQEKGIDFYGRLVREFVPNLITQHKRWRDIYKHILVSFGEKPFKNIHKQKPEKVIVIEPEFSGEGRKQPFQTCVQITKQIYDQCVPKKKIAKIKELIETVKQQIKYNQDMQIRQGKMHEHVQADADNILGIYAYCILMSDRCGLGPSIEYLELFYCDEKTESKFLQELGIEHTLATLRSACQYLHMEDDMVDSCH